MTYESKERAHLDYYPFGMLMPSRSASNSEYKYGFGGHEKDDEIKGSGNHLSFGDMGYDPRIVRRWNIDPLAQKNASWSPYVYALDNPIVFVDENGEWPGVTYFFYEFDAGAGLGWGVNYVNQTGVAFDDIGKTQFVMVSKIYITNQDFEEKAKPEMVMGLSASVKLGVTQDWGSDDFHESTDGYNAETGGFDAGMVGFGFGKNRFTIGLGLGVGMKLSVLNTQVQQSISLTDEEATSVNTTLLNEDGYGGWQLSEVTAKLDDNGTITGYVAKVAIKGDDGELIDTGVQVRSGVTENGESNGIYMSDDYKEELDN